MNPALMLLLLFDGEGEVIVPGPFRFEAAQCFSPGAEVVQSFSPGAVTAQSYSPGADAIQGGT